MVRTGVVEGAGKVEEFYQLLEQVWLVPVDLRRGRMAEKEKSEQHVRKVSQLIKYVYLLVKIWPEETNSTTMKSRNRLKRE